MSDKGLKVARNLSYLRYIIIFTALIVFCIIPLTKMDKRGKTIRNELMAAYPDAQIGEIKKSESSGGSEYYFQICDEDGNLVAAGYSNKDGHVTCDSYASVYYREQMEDYFVQTVDPDENYPGENITWSADIIANTDRFVVTEQVRSFDDFLNAENVRFGDDMTGNASTMYVWVELETTMEDMIAKMEEADFRIAVFFYNSNSDAMLSVGHYIPS